MPWGDVLLSAIAAVSWSLIGMAGTAALGLRLLDADAAGSLGPMTRRSWRSVRAVRSHRPEMCPRSDWKGPRPTRPSRSRHWVSVWSVRCCWRSSSYGPLRAAGVVVAPAELLARAGAVIALFVAMTGGLAWAGHDVVTIDGGSLGLDDLPGGGGGIEIPGLGDVGDIGGLLPDRIGDLVDAEATVGFTVDTAPTLLGGLIWSAGVLLIALLASRRTPPAARVRGRAPGGAAGGVGHRHGGAHRGGGRFRGGGLRGDRRRPPPADRRCRAAGAPNGVWLGVPVGLFVPWDGRATGELVGVLPRSAGRAAGRRRRGTGHARATGGAGRTSVAAGCGGGADDAAGRCADGGTDTGDAGVTARSLALPGGVLCDWASPPRPALPLLAWLTEVSVNASLSVLGVDAFGAGITLRGHLGTALLLGAVWGAGAGAAGALLARASGAAGARATPLARGAGTAGAEAAAGGGGTAGDTTYSGPPSGPYRPGAPQRPPDPGANPYLRLREGPENLRTRRRRGRPPRLRPLRGGRRRADGPTPEPGRTAVRGIRGRGARRWVGDPKARGSSPTATSGTAATMCTAPLRWPGRWGRHRDGLRAREPATVPVGRRPATAASPPPAPPRDPADGR
ncbi:streptophobe family protein [Streptomyces thinghirensis]|nr:streptophobe family protein [Streptomyces thinghirensis]